MSKRSVLLLLLSVLCISGVYAQSDNKKNSEEKSSEKALPPVKKPSRDFLMIQLGYNNWSKPDSIKTKPFGYVFKASFCYDFPIKKSKMSFATGLGVNANVIYLDNQKLINNDTGTYGASAHFVTNTDNPKRYKFVTTYLTAPFELRYFQNSNNRNQGFKAAIGAEVGLFLGAHTKEVTSVDGTVVKYKENTKRFISPWNFAATARIGWGNFSLFGSYNITGVFKTTNGPDITPFSLGLCVSGL